MDEWGQMGGGGYYEDILKGIAELWRVQECLWTESCDCHVFFSQRSILTRFILRYVANYKYTTARHFFNIVFQVVKC